MPRYQLIDVDHSHTTPMLNRESTRISHGSITSIATIGGNYDDPEHVNAEAEPQLGSFGLSSNPSTGHVSRGGTQRAAAKNAQQAISRYEVVIGERGTSRAPTFVIPFRDVVASQTRPASRPPPC